MNRRVVAHRFKASPTAEAAYVKALRSIMGQVHREVLKRLDLKEPVRGSLREDAVHKSTQALDEFGPIALRATRNGVIAAFDKMANSLRKHTKGQLVGITPKDTGLETAMATAREANISLMEKAGKSYIDQVRGVLEDPDNFNLPVKALTSLLLERADVSQSRAELIARDQTLKLNANITKIRAGNAGITSYVWTTSHDERVRPEHAELDGKTFDFATGAPSLDGLNPGEDFQCRCVPVVILPSDEA